MADRTVFGRRRVARILASGRDGELLDALGIPRPTGATRAWARGLLDDVEDFWESYDHGGEPDGGAAARAIEAELLPLAGQASMAGLAEACEALSRPLDDRVNLNTWLMALKELGGWQGGPVVAPPAGLAPRVLAALPGAGWPRTNRIASAPVGSTLDDWELAFWDKVEGDGSDYADRVLEARFVERVLRHLARVLSDEDREALVAWANAEDEAHQPGPRPAIWPPRVPLALPAAR